MEEKYLSSEFKFLKGSIKKHPTKNVNLEYLIRNDAIAVAVFDNSMENVYLVKQYRPGADRDLYEVVAGFIDDKEEPKKAMYRELREETGFFKEDVEKVVCLEKAQFECPGASTEKLYCYAVKLKKDAYRKAQKLDEGEDIEVCMMSVKDAITISEDIKTTFCISYFKDML